jgi:hypothetical protein
MGNLLEIEVTNKNTYDVGIGFIDRNGTPGKVMKVASGLTDEKFQKFYLQKKQNARLEILPPAIRYFSPKGGLIVWERPPEYHTISYTPQKQSRLDSNGQSRYTFRIPTPWQIYVISYNKNYLISNLMMFFASSSLKSLADDLSWNTVNNFYADNRLCQAVYTEIPIANNLFEMLSNAYDMVWNSGFNDDLAESIRMAAARKRDNRVLDGYIDTTHHYYDRWQRLTIDEVVTSHWPLSGQKLSDIIKHHESTSVNVFNIVDFVNTAQILD